MSHAVSHLQMNMVCVSEKAQTVPGLLVYSRFVLLHQSGQESCKYTNEEKAKSTLHI